MKKCGRKQKADILIISELFIHRYAEYRALETLLGSPSD